MPGVVRRVVWAESPIGYPSAEAPRPPNGPPDRSPTLFDCMWHLSWAFDRLKNSLAFGRSPNCFVKCTRRLSWCRAQSVCSSELSESFRDTFMQKKMRTEKDGAVAPGAEGGTPGGGGAGVPSNHGVTFADAGAHAAATGAPTVGAEVLARLDEKMSALSADVASLKGELASIGALKSAVEALLARFPQ
jgi:uncharacterized small protein (DUF1192 family)